MTDEITTNYLRPRFREVAEKRGKNKATISRVSGVPYQTVLNYYNAGDDLKGLRLNTFYAFLRGVGYSDAEILALPLGELFDIVESGN